MAIGRFPRHTGTSLIACKKILPPNVGLLCGVAGPANHDPLTRALDDRPRIVEVLGKTVAFFIPLDNV
jgi:hypothetical protein